MSGKRLEFGWEAFFIAPRGAFIRFAFPALLPLGVFIAMAREGFLSIGLRRDLPR